MKAEISTNIQVVQVRQKVEEVTLTLSRNEAETLLSITDYIGGPPGSRRSFLNGRNGLSKVLSDALGMKPSETDAFEDIEVAGGIYFKGRVPLDDNSDLE